MFDGLTMLDPFFSRSFHGHSASHEKDNSFQKRLAETMLVPQMPAITLKRVAPDMQPSPQTKIGR